MTAERVDTSDYKSYCLPMQNQSPIANDQCTGSGISIWRPYYSTLLSLELQPSYACLDVLHNIPAKQLPKHQLLFN